jgi:hypothetical protein
MNEEGFHAVDVTNINYLVDAPLKNHQLNELFAASWDAHQWTDFEALTRHSLGYACACLGEELIGFVNLAWDGESTHSSWIPPCTRTYVVAALGVGW